MPIRAGAVVRLNAMLTGELTLGFGPALLDGVSHQRVWYGGRLDFRGFCEVLADVSPTVSSLGFFTMRGELTAYASNPQIGPARELLVADVYGHGKARLELTGTDVAGFRQYDFARLTYTFIECV